MIECFLMEQEIIAQGRMRLVSRLERFGLPTAAAEALLSRYTLVRYPKHSPLFGEASPSDVVFAIIGGIVKVYCSRWGEGRILFELAGPGDLAGYADFSERLEAAHQSFEAEALTNSIVALFTRDHIMRVLERLDAATMIKLTANLNATWMAVVHRYAQFLGMSLRERLDAVFTELAARFGVADARGVLLTPEIGQEGLAEMIGGSRPMVNKLLSEMAHEGLIARQGRHYILRRGAFEPRPGL
ncbi:MAG: Crp/Fnr family transcriptional regulator [Candidatus Binataceae bacterium]